MDSATLITAARTWLGVPFLHQGRNRAGVDCAGFFVAMMREADALPWHFVDRRDYSRAPSVDLLEVIRSYCYPLEAVEPAALALIQWPRDPHPSHLGFITPGTIIHAYQSAGAVVEHGYRGRWPRLTHSLWRLPGVVP